jgi:hypothetical protein
MSVVPPGTVETNVPTFDSRHAAETLTTQFNQGQTPNALFVAFTPTCVANKHETFGDRRRL